jgi:hypothetical protein
MENNNNKYSNYTTILLKTFLKYSWFSNKYTKLNAEKDNIKNEVRIFPYKIKEKCWNNAPKVPHRDSNRWRYDAVGNPVLKILKGCNGIFCHEYDHIFPYSKGGTSTLDNCQILQTNINRLKGNQYYTKDELKTFSQNIPLSFQKLQKFEIGDNEMDLIEECIYGNVIKH